MDWLIVQTFVLGRGADGDENGWMQLLVFIVLAVFWAIGGIMKARAAKSQDEKQKQQGGTRPQPRPRPSFERLLRKEPEKARTRPMQAKAAKMARQLAQDKAAERLVKQPAQAKAVDYRYRGVPPEAVEEKKGVAEAAPRAAATALAVVEGPGVEIGTSEQLRAAILHYEIFGKCVGLREAQEHVWMR
jgi:hypothetical protein